MEEKEDEYGEGDNTWTDPMSTKRNKLYKV